MEYCLGSASDIIEVHKRPLREEEIAGICDGVLRGLDYLHTMNRIHRDVKAGNILLTEIGTVKLGKRFIGTISSYVNCCLNTEYFIFQPILDQQVCIAQQTVLLELHIGWLQKLSWLWTKGNTTAK